MSSAHGALPGLKDTLASIVETASLLEQHRQGEMTRQLAAWAAILAVPTAIAGIYGMNFDVHARAALALWLLHCAGRIGLVCAGLWLRFKADRLVDFWSARPRRFHAWKGFKFAGPSSRCPFGRQRGVIARILAEIELAEADRPKVRPCQASSHLISRPRD
jgi:hypothetical protein